MRARALAAIISGMRRWGAILLATWATAACSVGGAPAEPAAVEAAPSAVAAAPQITPAPVGPPVRILWAPMQPQPLPVAVRVDPGTGIDARTPALLPAGPEQRAAVERDFVSHFAGEIGLTTTLQNLRDQRFNGGEAWTFATSFAPGPFADHVRELVTTRRENETRTFRPGEATLEGAWLRPSSGAFGDAATVGVVEGTMSFTDEVTTGGGQTVESHRWRIRALYQGQFVVLDGAESPTTLAPLAPFDAAKLDAELGSQVAFHLHSEEAGPDAMPASPFKGTAYWDARSGALDWLHDLSVRGTLTDRHFEDIRAQVVQFKPTSYLGDGYVTVHLRGTLVETMNGVRHAYPVNESVVFQRFSFAQASWTAVDGQNDDGTWIANGDYGTPQSTAHG